MTSKQGSNHFPLARHRGLALWCLRLALLLQSVGLVRQSMVDGTPIGTTLFMNWGLPEPLMLAIDQGAAALCLLCAIALVARPRWRAPALPIAVWFLLVALLGWFQGGHFAAQLEVPAHAVRWAAPLALFVWLGHRARAGGDASDGSVAWRQGEWILRVAAASTFVAHGIEALWHHPRFIDYLITASQRLLSWRLTEARAVVLLDVIGAVDLIVAAALLARRWRAVAGYMALWGLVTASARIVYMGLPYWPQTAIRACNMAVPLALMFLWWPTADRSAPSEEEDEKGAGASDGEGAPPSP